MRPPTLALNPESLHASPARASSCLKGAEDSSGTPATAPGASLSGQGIGHALTVPTPPPARLSHCCLYQSVMLLRSNLFRSLSAKSLKR